MTQRHLTLVGLSEDQQQLVLVSDSGQQFTLAADARLRAALRGEHARLGQLEITMESTLRPRDIQARIRSGQSPEVVAAAAQTTVEKIMGFATPVLAERAHVAERALQASVRRNGQGSARVLADAVTDRLRARNVEPDSVEWDAWRRDDGRWTLAADYLSGESARHAEFVFDVPGRFVVADDDEARWLLGEQSASHGPQPRTGSGGRRLSAVDSSEDALPLGEDAIGMVNGTPVEPVRQVESGDGDAGLVEPTEVEADVNEPTEVELGSEADEDAPGPDTEAAAQSAAQSDSSPTEPAAEDVPPQRTARKGRRASVPSWDDIMFGGGRRE